MKRNIIHTPWVAALLLAFVSCSQDKLAGTPDIGGESELSIMIADRGYNAIVNGKPQPQTRAAENGYRTEFTAGDACGLYIVRDGTVVYNNVKLTATAGTDGSLTWQPEASVTLVGGFPDENYFLYYPYQADMDGKVNVSAADAEGFFAPLAVSWQPKADQSTYAAYTASDLMTAKGMVTKGSDGTLSLFFSMTHRMAMAVIEMPKTIYEFTNNTDGAIPDYVAATSANFADGEVQAYGFASGTYRCIVNPAGGTVASITGSYDNGVKGFTFFPDGIAAGCYKTYKIDGAAETVKSYDMQPGDYFCKNSSDNWYIIPRAESPGSECIGVVFHAGQHANDQSDYSDTGIGQKQCHGYAVALNDAISDYCFWGPKAVLGCIPKDASGNEQDNFKNPDIDWCGYAWTQKIITAAGGKNNLKSDYSATYFAVVDYENKVPAPAGSSGWFLPAIGQMWTVNLRRKMLKSVTGGNDIDSSWWYWSSSEYCYSPDELALVVNAQFEYVGANDKIFALGSVRPVLAF